MDQISELNVSQIPGTFLTLLLNAFCVATTPSIWRCDIQHDDIQHNDIQHNATQNNDIQHNYIQHNGIQHNDTQHNGLICDTQHKWHSVYMTFSTMHFASLC
jgi:hypothetical protein